MATFEPGLSGVGSNRSAIEHCIIGETLFVTSSRPHFRCFVQQCQKMFCLMIRFRLDIRILSSKNTTTGSVCQRGVEIC